MNKIYPIPAFTDNYIWAIHSLKDSNVAVVDPGDSEPVLRYLAENNLSLNAILITHHHWDHTGGLPKLLTKFPNIPVYGPENSVGEITDSLTDQATLTLESQNLTLTVLEIPGHTLDHIAYVGPEMLFCGDTLFSCGCGRVFEGTPKQMYDSLNKLATLGDSVKVYCGHEYTLKNLAFAQTIEPQNPAILKHQEDVRRLRMQGLPSLPSTLKQERDMNPFLRAHLPEIKNSLQSKFGTFPSDPIKIFAELRKMKDKF